MLTFSAACFREQVERDFILEVAGNPGGGGGGQVFGWRDAWSLVGGSLQ